MEPAFTVRTLSPLRTYSALPPSDPKRDQLTSGVTSSDLPAVRAIDGVGPHVVLVEGAELGLPGVGMASGLCEQVPPGAGLARLWLEHSPRKCRGLVVALHVRIVDGRVPIGWVCSKRHSDLDPCRILAQTGAWDAQRGCAVGIVGGTVDVARYRHLSQEESGRTFHVVFDHPRAGVGLHLRIKQVLVDARARGMSANSTRIRNRVDVCSTLVLRMSPSFTCGAGVASEKKSSPSGPMALHVASRVRNKHSRFTATGRTGRRVGVDPFA